VLEALLCNLSGKALCITQHKTILNYKELITFLRSNFGNNYSGHRLSADEVTPDKGKIDCVKKESIPKNTTDIKVFLGLKGYYRRFIEEYAKISKPLTCLLKKNAIFAWGDAHQYAFEKLKNILTREPILQYPDFDQEFFLETDVSNYALGCILLQGKMGKNKPIAYASRILNTSEINYLTIEKKCLGIVFGIKHFKQYLWGKKFKIITDHRPLVWLYNVSDMNYRLVRWRILLQEFDNEIIYKPSSERNADALSRICAIKNENEMTFEEFMNNNNVYINNNIEEVNENYSEIPSDYDILITVTADLTLKFNVLREYLLQLGHIGNQVLRNTMVKEVLVVKDNNKKYLYAVTEESFNQSPTYKALYETLINVKNVCEKERITKLAIPKMMTDLNCDIIRSTLRYIFKGSNIKIKIFTDYKISDDVKTALITEQHMTSIGGHQGVSRTVKRLRQWVQWKGMKKEVRQFINNCRPCRANKEKRKSKQLLVITTTSSRAFERVALDVIGPLTKSMNDYTHILTLQDDSTKFSVAYPLKSTDAATIAKTFVEKFVCYFGIPTNILSDQGSNCLSSLFKQICTLLKINKMQTTAYSKMTNGALRSHKILKECLRNFSNEKQENWCEMLSYAMYMYNTTPHTSHKFTPYELVFGKQPVIPSNFLKPSTSGYSYNDYVSELRTRMQEARQMAKKHLIETKLKSKSNYDKHINPVELEIGDKVLMKNMKKKKKLEPNWIGPYEIFEVHEPVNVSIRKNNKIIRVHTNHLQLFNETSE